MTIGPLHDVEGPVVFGRCPRPQLLYVSDPFRPIFASGSFSRAVPPRNRLINRIGTSQNPDSLSEVCRSWRADRKAARLPAPFASRTLVSSGHALMRRRNQFGVPVVSPRLPVPGVPLQPRRDHGHAELISPSHEGVTAAHECSRSEGRREPGGFPIRPPRPANL